MKNRRPLAMATLMLMVSLVLVATSCATTSQTTTTADGTATTSGGTETTQAAGVTAADEAIAAVTKSAAIQAPSTLKTGFLQAGCDASFPPLEYVTKDKVYEGFDIDLCTAIAKKMGLELEVVPVPWADIIQSLEDERFDIIMSAMNITPDRLQQVDFADAYLPGVLAITTPVDKPIADKAGLATKIVGVQADTVSQSEMATVGAQEIRVYNTVLEALHDMAAGKLDAVVNDQAASSYIIERDADFKEKLASSGTIETDFGYGYATRKGSAALLAAMNTALGELRAEGVYDKICAKWGLTGN